MRLSDLRALRRRILERHHPSGYLLLAQFLSLLLYATLDKTRYGQAILGVLGVMILAIVVWVVMRSPVHNFVAWILAGAALLLTMLAWILAQGALLPWAALAEALLYFYGAGGLIRYMMEDDLVTRDELYAAGATFTLLAWGYAMVFWFYQAWDPGAFTAGAGTPPTRTFLELLYLSFTNLSSTGLSDISPAAPISRVLLMLEQFTGVAYLAVVVSRLVGLTVARSRGRRDSGER